MNSLLFALIGIIQVASLSAMVVVLLGFCSVHRRRTELLSALGNTHRTSLILERRLLMGTYAFTTLLIAWATTSIVLALPL